MSLVSQTQYDSWFFIEGLVKELQGKRDFKSIKMLLEELFNEWHGIQFLSVPFEEGSFEAGYLEATLGHLVFQKTCFIADGFYFRYYDKVRDERNALFMSEITGQVTVVLN